jgi:hypothetical protein
MRRRFAWGVAGFAVLAGVGALSGCDEATAPEEEGVPEEELQFLYFPEELAPLATRDTSFWAVAGEDRELVIEYRPLEEGEDPEEFLEFEVPGEALYQRPDGSLFVRGDSVEIRVQVDPEGRFLFHFSPSGLHFSPDHPARLEIDYVRLNGDLNGDGEVDDEDEEIEQNLRIWKQEAPGEPWFPVGTIQVEDADELEGEITSFTGFAIAV